MSGSWNKIFPKVLSSKFIAAPHHLLIGALSKQSKSTSLGLVSCDRAHALWVALDEATKNSPIHMVQAKSLYGGVSQSGVGLAGESFAVFEGADDDVVREGMRSIHLQLKDSIYYWECSSVGNSFFAHVIARVGEFLPKIADVKEGESAVYLMASPVEALTALDQALKASQVELRHFCDLPEFTNVAGGLLVGELDACHAAKSAFEGCMFETTDQPVDAIDRGPLWKR